MYAMSGSKVTDEIGLFRVFIFWYHARRFAATIGRDTTMHGIQALTMIPDPRRRCGRHSPRFSLLDRKSVV